MEFKPQPLEIPAKCNITRNVFTTYDPASDYSEENSLCNLTEDLFHANFSEIDIEIDLGWYGDFETNKGTFRLLIIKGVDWDNPLMLQEATSQVEITEKLQLILDKLSE